MKRNTNAEMGRVQAAGSFQLSAISYQLTADSAFAGSLLKWSWD